MYGADRHDRWKGALGAAVLVAGIGYGLVAGLNVHLSQRIADELKVVTVLPDPPPPTPDPAPKPKQAQKRREGAASPPNLKAQATPVVAPPPVLRPPAPPPVVVATLAGTGGDPSQGAAPVAGPGTGSGGIGNGTGSGGAGDGDGGGGDGTAPELARRIRYKDLPRDLFAANVAGRVRMGLTVRPDGHVSGCEIVRSSGNPVLDAATCALAERDMRFRPARDRAGRKVAEDIVFEQTWTVTDRPDAQDPDDR